MKKIIGIICLMLLIAAGVVFAFWASSVTVSDGEGSIVIEVGEPLDTETNLSITIIDIVDPTLVPMGGAILTYDSEDVTELALVDITIQWTAKDNFAIGLEATFKIDVAVQLQHNVNNDEVEDEFYDAALDLIQVMLLDITSVGYQPALDQIQKILNEANRIYMIPEDVQTINIDNEVEEFEQTFSLQFNQEVQFLLLVYIERADMDTVKYLSDAKISVVITITLNDDSQVIDDDYGNAGG